MTTWTDDENGGTVWSDNETGGRAVTEFARTLLDDATASEAQSTLGLSDFAKTLVDDASAAAARSTLGVPGLTDLSDSTGSSLIGFAQSGIVATKVPSTVSGALSRAFGLLPMNGLSFYDTFSRADTSNGSLGTAESGQTWDLRGAYAGSYPLPAATGGKITDGIFVLDPAVSTVCYATYSFRAPVTRIGARISWTTDSGADASTFARVSSVDDKFIDSMLHFTVSRSTWKLQVRVAGGSFVDLLTGSFPGGLDADGTLHTFEVSFHNDTATVNADGTLDSVIDSRISANIGKYAFWEHFYNSSSASDRLRIHAVWAGTSPVDQHVGNVYSNNQETTIYGSTSVNCPDGYFVVKGTTTVEGTSDVIAHTSATGGFRRSRIRLLNHTNTDGITIEQKGDETNPTLDLMTVVSSTGTRRLRMTTQGLGFINIQNSITAFAGGGQASATALTGQLCRVTTCASAGDSVKLPAAVGNGTMIVVINSTANSCNVFPTSGEAIDAGLADAALAVAAGKRTTFYDIATDLWMAVPGA